MLAMFNLAIRYKFILVSKVLGLYLTEPVFFANGLIGLILSCLHRNRISLLISALNKLLKS